MAGAAGEVRIEGLRELNQALRKVNRQAAKAVNDELKRAAEPVRGTAQTKAFGDIRNIGSAWGKMRLSARVRGVYLAPASRRAGGSPRPNLGLLLLDKAMFPALEQHQGEIEEAVGDAIDRLGRSAGF